MENQINKPQHTRNSKTTLGIILLVLGSIVLLNRVSFFLFPHWLFSWPLVLILTGLFIGSQSNFRKSNWIFITAIGVLFLLPNIIPSLSIGMLWPLLMMALGATIYTRSRQRWTGDHWEKRDDDRHQQF
jgi:hypothetical protein